MLMSLCASGLVALAVADVPMPDPADYVGLRVVELNVPDDAVVNLLLEHGIEGLACRPAPGPGPWIVGPDDQVVLDTLGVNGPDLVPDLSAFIAQRNAERRTARAAASARGTDPFYTDFRTLDEYSARLDQFLLDHADIASGIMLGFSHEGRPIRGVVLNPSGDDKPAVLFNGCQHAREWISPPTTMYIADTLADAYGSDPAITALMDKVEVVVIPVVNPDGYAYTYESGGDRYWRKNRRDNSGSCDGVDLNRNWGSDWNGGESTSNDPCSDVYVGPSSMSEPEVQALANYCTAHGEIKAQVDFHAYSELILEPRGYTTVPPPDWDELHALGGEMADAIESVHGVSYVHDNPCNILYCASGTLIDWPYDTYGSKAYCIELRPGSGGIGGFDPPPSEIIPCAEENFQAALVLMQDVATPMSIALPDGHPSIVSTDVVTSFDVTIAPRSESPNAATAVLHHRGEGGSFDLTPLTHMGGDDYQATLPTFSCDEMPEYYISVESMSGNAMTYPVGAPGALMTSVVMSDVDVVFDDDCETDPGWSVSGTATDGSWERGVPAGGGDRGDPPADADGSGQCWVTDNVAGNSDVDGGDTILTSPVLEIPGDGWSLGYSRWYSNNFGAAPNQDILSVQWSAVGSSTWSDLEIVGPSGPGTGGGWYDVSFELDALGLAGVNAFQLRVIADDSGDGSVVEAGFDAVTLAKMDCQDGQEPCPGDLDGNGAIDVNDILDVLAVFGSDDPSGDANGDGMVDVNDVLLVIGNFGPC